MEDLRDKVALEFSKKRKMKQDYDEHVTELNEEVEHYKEKYNDMKELLSSCREQLKEFEELNVKRNDVIEQLETENNQLKQSYTSSKTKSGS